MPRRRAYPRLALSPDSASMKTVDLAGLSLRINREATFRPDSTREGWADIVYPPELGTTVYLSLTRPESAPEAIANRRQRMSLNLGEASATSEEFVNGRWLCTLVWSGHSGLTTPVQILAVNADGRLLSGAAVLRSPGENADSLAPLVELLCSDARMLLKSLE